MAAIDHPTVQQALKRLRHRAAVREELIREQERITAAVRQAAQLYNAEFDTAAAVAEVYGISRADLVSELAIQATQERTTGGDVLARLKAEAVAIDARFSAPASVVTETQQRTGDVVNESHFTSNFYMTEGDEGRPVAEIADVKTKYRQQAQAEAAARGLTISEDMLND